MKHGHSDQRHIVLEFKKLVEPDWVGLQNPHNHLVVEEAFLRADPKKPQFNQLKRKKSDFECHLRLRRHLSGFGGQFWFLGSRMWGHPIRSPYLSCAQLGQSVLCKKKLTKPIYEHREIP